MARLTTHILDTSTGRPAAGVVIELYAVDMAGVRAMLSRTMSNRDGRTDAPLLADASFQPGLYELEFSVGDYFRRNGAFESDTIFLDTIPVRFMITETDRNCHLPLLVSPYSYSTYRSP